MPPGGLCGVARFDGAPVASDELSTMATAARWRGAATVTGERERARLAALGGAGVAATDRPTLLRVVADARLLRRSELIRTLRGEGTLEADRATDAELILAAYRAWGTGCPDHLLGDFAFAIWDGSRKILFCARDPVGVRPLHYARSGAVLRVASDAGQILAAGAPRVLDGHFLLDAVIRNFREQARSPWAGIRRLLPGHCLVMDGEGARGWRYWHPQRASSLVGGLPDGEEDHDWVVAFRDLLETVVLDHFVEAAGPVGIMTSGGVDSSTVAALAQDLDRRGELPHPPIAISDVFERIRECDESEYSDLLVAETGIAAERIVADDLSDLCPDPSWVGPVDSPFAPPGERMGHALQRLRERGGRMVVTGFGGDSLFDAARWQNFDLVRSGRVHRLGPWIAGARDRGVSWHRAVAAFLVPPLLTDAGRRRLDRLRGRNRYQRVPTYLAPKLAGLARARLQEQRYPRRFPGFARQRQYEHLVGLAAQGPAIESWTAHAARYGIDACYPLLDRRLAEYVLQAPLELCARPGPGGSKWLLREATRGWLPEPIRLRPDKGSWDAAFRDALCHRLRAELAARFSGESRLMALGLIEDGAVRDRFDGACAGDSAGSVLIFNFLYLLESWLLREAPAASGLRFEELDAWERETMA